MNRTKEKKAKLKPTDILLMYITDTRKSRNMHLNIYGVVNMRESGHAIKSPREIYSLPRNRGSIVCLITRKYGLETFNCRTFIAFEGNS